LKEEEETERVFVSLYLNGSKKQETSLFLLLLILGKRKAIRF